MWFIKRKRNLMQTQRLEYYRTMHAFQSLTKTDLRELAKAPFSNPDDDLHATQFMNFVVQSARNDFANWKTSKPIIKKCYGVYAKDTIRHLKNALSPRTDHITVIPLPEALPDGTLDTLE